LSRIRKFVANRRFRIIRRKQREFWFRKFIKPQIAQILAQPLHFARLDLQFSLSLSRVRAHPAFFDKNGRNYTKLT
jgi:hypothetical protein